MRSKLLSDADNLLPLYSRILSELCPMTAEDFDNAFNAKLKSAMPTLNQKSIDNHRTEMSSRLLAMWYEEEGMVHMSPRVTKYLLSADSDQPAFFKDLLYKFQTPNGADSVATIKSRIADGIKFRNYCKLVQIMNFAEANQVRLTQREIGYYILNAQDVLSGAASPVEILGTVVADRAAGRIREVSASGKASSYTVQHIREQLSLLGLANLVRRSGSASDPAMVLNFAESRMIDLYAKAADTVPFVMDLGALERDSTSLRADWQKYYATPSNDLGNEALTRLEALKPAEPETIEVNAAGEADADVGTAGEAYVYAYEKRRVARYKPAAVARVKLMAHMRGIGYDVQSVKADEPEPDVYIQIEVKSTKRVTLPDIASETWEEVFSLTQNEWHAANTYKDRYFIYRVYFTGGGTKLHQIQDPLSKVHCEPSAYRITYDVASAAKEMPTL